MLEWLENGGAAAFGWAPERRFRARAESRGRQVVGARTLRPPRSELIQTRASGAKRFSLSWAGSLLLHAALLVLGFSLLFHPARFDVASGRTSTELVLVSSPPEPVASAPMKTVVPVSVPPPQALPVLSPAPVQVMRTPTVAAPAKPKAVLAPLALHQAAKPESMRVTQLSHETAAAARGAVLARPDDLNNPPPVYPDESRAAREQGVVMLQVDVTPKGSPSRVAVLRSSGYFRLDQAARSAVEAWRFHPASVGTEAIESEVDVPVRFELQ